MQAGSLHVTLKGLEDSRQAFQQERGLHVFGRRDGPSPLPAHPRGTEDSPGASSDGLHAWGPGFWYPFGCGEQRSQGTSSD